MNVLILEETMFSIAEQNLNKILGQLLDLI